MRILITCGGTGGHIFPAIALAQELKRRGFPDSVFVIDKSHNTQEMISKAGFNYHVLDAPKMPYGISLMWFNFLARFIRSRFNAVHIISRVNPDIAVGFGAYISGPVILAAAAMGIKTLVHEQNALFGRANRMLFKTVDRVCLSFDNNLRKKDAKCAITGNPVRRDIIQGFKMITKQEALSALRFSKERNTLLVIGGSSGASSINKAVSEMVKTLDDRRKASIQILHITGYRDMEKIERAYRVSSIVHWVRGFYDKMPLCYKAADLVLCRAGATTISEIAFFGIPAVLIPYPWAGHHQLENALSLAREGAAVVLAEKELTPDRLKKEVFSIINNKEEMKQMANNIRLFSKPDAVSRLACQVMELVDVK
jgi:UDP-N-acetylglucosamine--N-acetylmuramyl-(pentapeptide) pyrophosphoryl-undecaprenol N-acetylglucosamine transferase